MSRRSHTKKRLTPPKFLDPLELVLWELEHTRFPLCTTRKNISNDGVQAFALGYVNYRGQAAVQYRTKGPSRFNKKFKSLYKSLRALIRYYDPDFKYTTIQVNKNVFCNPHVDKNNMGPSYGIALGDFTGGKLVVEGKEFNIHNKFLQFDGRKGHWITPFEGTRYSIIYFNHTFLPPHPSLKNIEVTHEGLYQNGNLIKSYE